MFMFTYIFDLFWIDWFIVLVVSTTEHMINISFLDCIIHCAIFRTIAHIYSSFFFQYIASKTKLLHFLITHHRNQCITFFNRIFNSKLCCSMFFFDVWQIFVASYNNVLQYCIGIKYILYYSLCMQCITFSNYSIAFFSIIKAKNTYMWSKYR